MGSFARGGDVNHARVDALFEVRAGLAMRVLAIDPGTTQSAWCLLDDDGMPVGFGIAQNESVLHNLPSCFGYEADVCVIEMVQNYGTAVGQDVFRTIWWTGRFAQAWFLTYGKEPDELLRSAVKLHLCGRVAKVTDSNVRQSLINVYGGEGGEKAAVGRKASPGPCYGITKDVWAALAVGVTAQARFKQQARAA